MGYSITKGTSDDEKAEEKLRRVYCNFISRF